MSPRTGAAAPLPQRDESTEPARTGRSESVPVPVSVPPPITTRWAPVQRNGAPPLRRRAAAVAPPAALGAAAGDDGGVGPDREPARVLPLEDETTRRVIAQSRAVGQAILEVLAGARPASQLVRWMDPAVHDALVLRADLIRAGAARVAARTGQTTEQQRPPFRGATIRSVHACRVTARRYELSLVVSEPGRCRAMALRLELRHLQWRVTALQIG